MKDRSPGALWALILCAAVITLAFAQPASATDLKLSWNPVTTDSAGKPLPAGASVSYNVYGAAQGQPFKLIANVLTTSTVRSNVNAGSACYAVSALVTPASVIQVQESAQTAMICSTVAAPPPAKPAAPAAPTNFQIQQIPPTARYVPFGRHRRLFA